MKHTARIYAGCLAAALALSAASRPARAEAPSAPAQWAVIHVSPNGDDAGDGSAAAPLRTLAAAAARARRTGGARIVLADGMYETDEPFVLGAADKNLVFEATEGAVPIVSAGRRITGWTVDAKGWWRARVPQGRRFAQFYVNSQRRTRPFLPRKGYYFVEAAGGAEPDTGRERFICAKGNFPEGANPDMEVCMFHVWSITRAKVSAWEPERRRVTLDSRHLERGYEAMNTDRWYRFDNVRSALGEPGDWHLDPERGELVYVPMPGETPESCETVAAWHRHAVLLDGAEDVTFRGVMFAYSDYGVQDGGNHVAQAAADQPGAVHAEGVRRVRLENCAVAHTGAYGAVFTRGSEGCAAEKCEFFDLGAGGVRIGDGWEKTCKPIISRDCAVEDCIVEGGGRVDPAGVGVWIGHGAGCRIAHNTIHDMYYSGVSVGWNWAVVTTARDNIIEWNHIYDIGQHVLSDMGGIYLLGAQPGTVERYNHIHHVTRSRNCAFGVYFDSGTAFVTVTNNVVHDCGDCNFFCAVISASNRVENNVFAYGPRFQLNNPARGKSPSCASVFARNIVMCDSPRKLISVQPDERSFIYHDNIAWCGGKPLPDKIRGFTMLEPKFADPAARDFRLVDDAAVRAIGFVPFSIEGCGRRPPRRFTLSSPPVPSVFFPAPEKPPFIVAEDSEKVPVGDSWPRWVTFPRGAKWMHVTDKTAASGSRSLEVVDGLDTWTPHMFLDVKRAKPGPCRISFALKFEAGAMPEFEVREQYGVWQTAPGPKINVSADGWLWARSKRLVKLPADTWIKVEIAFELGAARKEHAYSVSVSLPDESAPRVFAGNPMDKEFLSVYWLGFQSNARGGVRYWIDDFSMVP